MNLFSARPQHDAFGITNAILVAPGEPERSVLLHRVSRRGRGQMPPLVTERVDARAAALLTEWIAAMEPQDTIGHEWTTQDLMPELGKLDATRALDAGKAVYRKVGCAQCHRFGGEGGSGGPDLSGIG